MIYGLGAILLLLGIGVVFWRRHNRPIAYPAPLSLVVEPDVDLAVLRRENGAVAARWHGDDQPAHIYAGTQPDAIDRSQPLKFHRENDDFIVSQLDPLARFYLELDFADGRKRITAERGVAFEEIANFRDIGGYLTTDGRRVRWGRVFRAGAFAQATEADLTKLAALNIRLVCDLRSDDEVTDAPDQLPTPTPQYVHLPLDAGDETLKRLRAVLLNRKLIATLLPDAYVRIMIEGNARLFGDVLRRLANPAHLPAVIHCTAGKDRTGVSIALLLLWLGVPEATVIADYTLSNFYYDNFYRFADAAMKPLRRLGVRVEDLQPILMADSATMQTTILHIKTTYGSVETYLRERAGLSVATLAALKTNLLDP
jgi:protein-tyrosine phosphatase